MLRLSWEQFELLEAIALKRHAASISKVLAASWPAMTDLLKERWPAFVEAAVLQGRKHGVVEAGELARYASLWCIWGPAFDTKPGFAWAAEILADPRRSATLKLHQLVHRTRDELQRRLPAAAGAAPAVTVPQLDLALAGVQTQMDRLSAARSVFPVDAAGGSVLACDVGSIDMMVAGAENLQEYRHAANRWQRLPLMRANDPHVSWSRAPEAPVEIAVTSHGLRRGAPARLNLRVDTVAICDPRVHPEIFHVGPEGRLAWKGRDAARLSLALYAPLPVPLEPGEAAPGIAAEAAPDAQTVRIESCGLRDAGAPFGDVTLKLRVYPATQWLSEIRHPSWSAMTWPPSDEAAAPPPVCSLEADGAAADAVTWQQSWAGLHAVFRSGMDRLYNEWVRALDGQATRLEVDASPLIGQASFTWGWQRTAAEEVRLRTQGDLDLIACAIDLRLSGELVIGSARSRIRILCKGRTELRMTIAQLGGEAVEGQDLKSALRTWRYPFTLEIEPLAGAEPATLGVSSGPLPITGALVGECGLRPRPDAAGHQWFFALRSEPVSVFTETADPVFGVSRSVVSIFPALQLVDWSAG
ncbi:MAG: hypothetical protein ABI281_02755 [Caldimonas sp.]